MKAWDEENKEAEEGISKAIDMLHEFATEANMGLYGTIMLVPEDGEPIVHTITTD